MNRNLKKILFITLVLAFLITGCSSSSDSPSDIISDPPSGNTNTTPGGGEDIDNDNFTVEQGDCDDTQASTYPGAPDTCEDGIDQDCDGKDRACVWADLSEWTEITPSPSDDSIRTYNADFQYEVKNSDPDADPKYLSPGCSACPTEDGTTDPEFRFYAKHGSSNNLGIYFMGGGGCWSKFTCTNLKPYSQEVNVSLDLLIEAQHGLLEDENGEQLGGILINRQDNPFVDWSFVVIPYCTGDIHMGANDYDYANLFDSQPLVIQHRGAVNFHAALDWMKKHISTPDKIFISGSSAGSYPAMFHFPYVQDHYQTAETYVLGDGHVGVIPANFQEKIAVTWNFQLPYIIEKDLTEIGIVEGIQTAAEVYENVRIAEFTTDYDWNQAYYYQVMMLPIILISPFHQLLWHSQMRNILHATAEGTDNFNYYIAAGEYHTILLSAEFYKENSAEGKPVIEWLQEMITNDPNWTTYEYNGDKANKE